MIAIVVVGYSRPLQTRRLLNSILLSDYGQDEVDLIISVDKGPLQAEVCAEAEAIMWTHGKKIIKQHPERMGLKTHIITCGDLSYIYDAVIVLEDDLVVSPDFYNYAKQCTDYYCNEERVFGISLYAHAFLPSVQRPFIPEWNGKDTYFMQYAQSWGQCWTRKMWDGFKCWLKDNENHTFDNPNTPQNVCNWKRSWLKYYIQYAIDENGYFVYPYYSLTTNMSEVGEHCQFAGASYQVPLFRGRKTYDLADFEAAIKYDAFWERADFNKKIPGFENKKVCIDLYGYKRAFDGYDYLMSTASRPYRIICEYALSYRPHEINCLVQAEGRGLFLYDLHSPGEPPKYNSLNVAKYDFKDASFKKTWVYTKDEFSKAVKVKISRFFKH